MTINAILWASNTSITILQSSTAMVRVRNQYTGDPAFALDGYHLTVGSAAIDRGVDAGVVVDIDGESRPVRVDYVLGADELLWYEIYLPRSYATINHSASIR